MTTGRRRTLDWGRVRELLPTRSLHQTAVILGVSDTAVKYAAKTMGVQAGKKWDRSSRRKLDYGAVPGLLARGMTYGQVGEIYGVDGSSIAHAVARMGMEANPVGRPSTGNQRARARSQVARDRSNLVDRLIMDSHDAEDGETMDALGSWPRSGRGTPSRPTRSCRA